MAGPTLRGAEIYLASWEWLSSIFPRHVLGAGVWKLNSSLLSDEEFVAKVTSFWSEWQAEKNPFPDLTMWWDAGKMRLKRLMCCYSWNRLHPVVLVLNL